jgi:ABC-type microcin C transport system duplicated ATPase subunit YejF
MPEVRVGGLRKEYGKVSALNGVNLTVYDGEYLSIVGPSGCGKTTLGLSIIGLLPSPPAKYLSGEVNFHGKNLLSLAPEEMRLYRGTEIAMIFQDPQSSLDPRMTIGDSIGEALLIHGVKSEKERMERVSELLKQVGLEPEHAARYPHEFSGGQRQRLCIARALALSPKFIVADEPVSMLDASVRVATCSLP